MKLSRWGGVFAMSLISLLSAIGIDLAYADSYTWSSISSANLALSYGAKSVSMSSDGSTIIIGRAGDGVFLSTNSGGIFTQISTSSIPSGSYFATVSANGMKMMAASSSSASVYVSTDRGVTWAAKTTSTSSAANRVCMSGDGSRWIVLANLGVSVSTDNGNTWATINPLSVGAWNSCAMSNDGTRIFVLKYGSALKYSTDSGSTWSTSTNTYSSAFTVASTSDGNKIVLVDRDNKKIYTSTDFGATFTEKYTAVAAIYDAAISSDGSRILIGISTGRMATSVDGGANWSLETTPPSAAWGSVAMSAAGTRVIASTSNGGGSNYLGVLPQPALLSMQSISPNASPLIYRAKYTLSALSNAPGKVTFYANGKKIAKCSQVPTTSLISTCVFSPSIHGVITITASIISSDSAYLNGTSQLIQTAAVIRSGNR